MPPAWVLATWFSHLSHRHPGSLLFEQWGSGLGDAQGALGGAWCQEGGCWAGCPPGFRACVSLPLSVSSSLSALGSDTTPLPSWASLNSGTWGSLKQALKGLSVEFALLADKAAQQVSALGPQVPVPKDI